MSDQTALAAVVELAQRWRYEHREPETPERAQQREDGRILLKLLEDHGLPWPTEYANKIIPAPGLPQPASPTERLPDINAAWAATGITRGPRRAQFDALEGLP
jgi:hypothetical protein